MLDITDSRLLDILSPRIKRTATVYESGQEPSPAVYWKTRPPDERIAAVIATVSLMSVKNKLASGRLQDLADVEHLEAFEDDTSAE